MTAREKPFGVGVAEEIGINLTHKMQPCKILSGGRACSDGSTKSPRLYRGNALEGGGRGGEEGQNGGAQRGDPGRHQTKGARTRVGQSGGAKCSVP